MRLLVDVGRCFALSALLAVFGHAPAAAQVQPDFWVAATYAATDKGDQKVAPETKALILGAALDEARRSHNRPARESLAELQLMLAYVELGKIEDYRKSYEIPSILPDGADATPDLVDYLPTVRRIADVCYKRVDELKTDPNTTEYRVAAFCAKTLSRLEVKLRETLAADKALALADAYASRGLVFLHQQEIEDAINDFTTAQKKFSLERGKIALLELVNKDFRVEPEAKPAGAETSPILETNEYVESFVVSTDEPYLPFILIRAFLDQADQAIVSGDKTAAEAHLQQAEKAVKPMERFYKYLLSTWACHPSLVLPHSILGRLHIVRLRFDKKFGAAATSHGVADYKEGAIEYKRALAIQLYSQGSQPGQIKAIAEWYSLLLTENGQTEAANTLAGVIKAATQANAVSRVGVGSLPEWRDVLGEEALDCAAKAR